MPSRRQCAAGCRSRRTRGGGGSGFSSASPSDVLPSKQAMITTAEAPRRRRAGPEQFGMAVLAHLQQPAIARDHLCKSHAAGGRAMLAHQHPTPPPSVSPTTPTVAAKPLSGASPYGSAAAITSRHLEPASTRAVPPVPSDAGVIRTPAIGEVDQQRAIRRHRMTMAAALHRDREQLLARKRNRGHDVRGTQRQHDDRWPLLERRRVPCLTPGIVSIVARREHAALSLLPHGLKLSRREGCRSGRR